MNMDVGASDMRNFVYILDFYYLRLLKYDKSGGYQENTFIL